MRQNRKVSRKMNRIAMHTMHIGAIMLTAFVMVIVNLLASSSCDQLVKAVDERDKRLKQCDADLERASVAWEKMKAPASLDHALMKWGIAMRQPDQRQVVHMDASGRPKPAQLSVALARQRSSAAQAASVSPQRRRSR